MFHVTADGNLMIEIVIQMRNRIITIVDVSVKIKKTLYSK